MKQKVIFLVDPILSFLQKFKKTKARNMKGLMMDAQHKAMCLVSLLFGKEQGIEYVNEDDSKSFYTMLLKCYQHLHLAYDGQSNTMNCDESSTSFFPLLTFTLFHGSINDSIMLSLNLTSKDANLTLISTRDSQNLDPY